MNSTLSFLTSAMLSVNCSLVFRLTNSEKVFIQFNLFTSYFKNLDLSYYELLFYYSLQKCLDQSCYCLTFNFLADKLRLMSADFVLFPSSTLRSFLLRWLPFELIFCSYSLLS